MKKIISFLSLVFFSFSLANAQVPAAAANLKAQAAKMGTALLTKDYKTFAAYTHPKVLELMGGADKMTAILDKGSEAMKAKGISFEKITLEQPLKIVKVGSELQSSIVQHLLIKMPNGNTQTSSTLLGFSEDNGVHWKFLDAGNKDFATIRKLIPNLSADVVIPAQQAPVKVP
ncbi:hypothetical protein GA0116948_11382 [Chitinophaga costaii]|uniref:DUF4440 domain-containing protein n=1 Tax=Chitinophaga costaii TaxID=1335309 RepID=A0A1C4FD55_9BACT|nr:hypothetical protein [Chitinophaga costaii]PUZ20671.1 hypothetical protein DCM91_18065 [Chitinophaga costaii]SCC53840.1 hypothetical protein GA0116948_11382 [Chitinophaga costaii]